MTYSINKEMAYQSSYTISITSDFLLNLNRALKVFYIIDKPESIDLDDFTGETQKECIEIYNDGRSRRWYNIGEPCDDMIDKLSIDPRFQIDMSFSQKFYIHHLVSMVAIVVMCMIPVSALNMALCWSVVFLSSLWYFKEKRDFKIKFKHAYNNILDHRKHLIKILDKFYDDENHNRRFRHSIHSRLTANIPKLRRKIIKYCEHDHKVEKTIAFS